MPSLTLGPGASGTHLKAVEAFGPDEPAQGGEVETYVAPLRWVAKISGYFSVWKWKATGLPLPAFFLSQRLVLVLWGVGGHWVQLWVGGGG